MAPTLHDLGIDLLNVEDRIALALAIWNSIPPRLEEPLITESQRQELSRRLADHERNPSDVVSWEQVKNEAMNRYASARTDLPR